MILYSEGATKFQEDQAEDILGALTVAYPGYPWAVRVYDGGFFIRNLELPSNYGMNCRTNTKMYSSSAIKREVIMMAGEFLERCNLRRGIANGDPLTHIEGVPEKWQPLASKAKIVLNPVGTTQ